MITCPQGDWDSHQFEDLTETYFFSADVTSVIELDSQHVRTPCTFVYEGTFNPKSFQFLFLVLCYIQILHQPLLTPSSSQIFLSIITLPGTNPDKISFLKNKQTLNFKSPVFYKNAYTIIDYPKLGTQFWGKHLFCLYKNAF